METIQPQKPLVFAQIGDLHITNAKERNFTDFLSILVQLETACAGRLGVRTIVVATSAYRREKSNPSGSDLNRIGSWPDNGIPGTQLGPNRNAKPFA